MKRILFLFSLMISLTVSSYTQSGFRGAAILGLTTSQIDGDELFGFKKLGLSSGIKVGFDFSSKIGGNVELLYSQRGASEKVVGNNETHKTISLSYFELPLYVTFNDWYIEKDNYYKMSGHLGFSYAGLISSKVQNTAFDEFPLNNSDFSYLFGASFNFSPRWSMTARYTRALSKLLEEESLSNNHLLSYFWTIRSEYYF